MEPHVHCKWLGLNWAGGIALSGNGLDNRLQLGRALWTLVAALVFWSPLTPADCVSGTQGDHEFDFARVIFLEKDSSRLAQSDQMQGACNYMDLSKNTILSEARAELPTRDYQEMDVQSEIQRTHDAIVWTPDTSDIEQAYVRKIKKIGEEPNPVLRIKNIYNLVNAHRGTYKLYDWDGQPNPGKTLLKAATTGSGGVCRDFSSLLVWSLNQVTKFHSDDAEYSVQTKHLPNHALVTVRLFRTPGARSESDLRFALDPTNYPSFTPLPLPDLESPRTIVDQNLDRCQGIYRCMAILRIRSLASP
jgi:hypothetical protein